MVWHFSVLDFFTLFLFRTVINVKAVKNSIGDPDQILSRNGEKYEKSLS